MKKIFTFIFFLGLIQTAFSGELVFSGIYQGKNVYVQNPFSPVTKQFCTNDVFVNDILTLTNINKSAYTINLSKFPLGTTLHIKITYKNDCVPKVINAFVLQKTDQNYTFESFEIERNILSWSLKEEVVSGRFIVEKYTENYWKPISTNAVALNTKKYSFNAQNYITEGNNKFRVKYLSPYEKVFLSSNLSYESKGESVTFLLTSSNKIILSKESPYEIIDAEGNKIKDGKGNEIPISNLNPGVYYLNYANKSEKFLKK